MAVELEGCVTFTKVTILVLYDYGRVRGTPAGGFASGSC